MKLGHPKPTPRQKAAPQGLRRTGFSRKCPMLASKPARVSDTKPRSRLKSRAPKMTAIRKSARGEACTLRFDGICNRDPATTVLCHRNGAGAGMKSLDTEACYGCHACHMTLDGHFKRPEWMSREFMLCEFERALGETRAILARKGLVEVAA